MIPCSAAPTLRGTVSIGVASGGATQDSLSRRLIDRADKALYEAKRLGRNRVVAADDPADAL